MRTIQAFFVTCLVLVCAASAAAQPSMLYAVNEGGDLLTIDPRSLEERVIGRIGVTGVTSLAYDARKDVLYGITGDGQLLTIDRTSGAGRVIQVLPVVQDALFATITYDSEAGGRLFAANVLGEQELVRIDLVPVPPHPVTVVGSSEAQITGMAVQPESSILYATNRNRSALAILDRWTARYTSTFPNAGVNNPENIAFDPESGKLFGVFSPGTLGVYDLVTGKATRVGTTTSAGALVSAPGSPVGRPRPLRVGDEVLQVFETPHPYTVPMLQSTVIHHPGATYIAPHFERFELAPRDFIIIRSPDGSRSWRYERFGKGLAGRFGGFWGGHIAGDTAIIDLYRYGVESAYGYRIDRYARGFQQEELNASEARTIRTEALCGPDDSKEARCFATSDPLIYNRARPVARLLINGVSLCTGWLLGSEGQLMTNHHCIGNATDALNTDVEFTAEGATCATSCASPMGCPGTTVASSTTFVRANASLDYALVTPQTTVNLPATYGYLQARPGTAVVGERIYIPQHPAGWGKRIAVTSSDPSDPTGFAQIDTVNATACLGGAPELGYAADTQGGSSGSPVIAFADHLVIGLHHCGACPNRAVPIETVIDDLGLDRPDCAVASIFGCNPGISTNNVGSCATCTSSSQCAFGLSCVNGKCIASGFGAIGTKCCNDIQCASKRCGSDGLCRCNSNVDCPSGQACRNGRCREARPDCEGCLFNFQCASGDCRAGRCITVATKGLGQDCCRDGQCVSGSCSAAGTCQCKGSSGCPIGFFCNVSLILDNACEPYRLSCDRCSADKQCGPGMRCDGKPFGRCIKGNENRPIGADCCRDGQCASGSCPADNSKCQCAKNSDCPSGNYCALGFLGIGKNTCKPYAAECDHCTADKQCAPGATCVFGVDGIRRCATNQNLPKGASCCRGRQCKSNVCKLNRKCK